MLTGKNNNEELSNKAEREENEELEQDLNNKFPLSGGETDEDLEEALGLDDEDEEDED